MSGERVTNLRVLKGYLYADVRLGYTDQDVVTTTVRLNTGSPAVQEALEPLYEVLRERARSLAGQALNAQELLAQRDAAAREIQAQVAVQVERQVNARTTEIAEAIDVVRSVGRVRKGETWQDGDRRRNSIRKLGDLLRAVGS